MPRPVAHSLPLPLALSLSLALAACQAGGLPAPTDPTVGGQVALLKVETLPLPGGATFADLQRDTNWRDDFDPKVPARFSAHDYLVDGVATNAVLETRGKSTRLAPQKSFRIALGSEATPWREQMDVLLNKHPYDHSRLRNKLAFDLFQGLPELMAPKTGWAKLEVDGQDLGLFTQIERLDKAYLRRHRLDEKASLYKAELFEFLRYPEALKLSTDPSYKKADFEVRLEVQGSKDHAPLLAMLDAVADAKQDASALMAGHFDQANYLSWFAANILADNVDTSSQNFYLYRASGAEARWKFIPWDFDGAWGYYRPDEPRSGRLGRIGRAQDGAANWWGVHLHRKVLKDAKLREALLKRMDELLAGPYSAQALQAQLQPYRAVVLPNITQGIDAERLRASKVEPAAQFEAEMALIPQVPALARERFVASLKRPMPIFLGEPVRTGEQVRFVWEKSTDLQGDALSYKLIVGRDPALTEVVATREDLTEVNATLPLPPGTYFWSVEVRDATGEWQLPFDRYWDQATDTRYHGVLRSEIP